MATPSAPPSTPEKPPVKDLKLKALMISDDEKYKDVKIGNGFSFLAPARVLKRAFHGLADLDFNPEGLGLMEVCQGGFEVTVCNDHEGPGERIFGLLSLKAAGLKEFFCETTMSRMITLGEIVGFLDKNASDDDFVKVFNAEGSNDLCFLLENELDGVPQRFPLEVPFSTAKTITKFPAFSYGFETDIPRNKLEPVLDSILALEQRKRPPHVAVNIDTIMGIKTGKFELKKEERKIVMLIFPYWDSLKRTITLANPLTLQLVTSPAECVALRFNLTEVGDFMYLKYGSEHIMSEDLPTIGTFKPIFP